MPIEQPHLLLPFRLQRRQKQKSLGSRKQRLCCERRTKARSARRGFAPCKSQRQVHHSVGNTRIAQWHNCLGSSTIFNTINSATSVNNKAYRVSAKLHNQNSLHSTNLKEENYCLMKVWQRGTEMGGETRVVAREVRGSAFRRPQSARTPTTSAAAQG